MTAVRRSFAARRGSRIGPETMVFSPYHESWRQHPILNTRGRPILALLVVVVIALLGLVVDESAFVALGVVDRGACPVLGPGSPYLAP